MEKSVGVCWFWLPVIRREGLLRTVLASSALVTKPYRVFFITGNSTSHPVSWPVQFASFCLLSLSRCGWTCWSWGSEPSFLHVSGSVEKKKSLNAARMVTCTGVFTGLDQFILIGAHIPMDTNANMVIPDAPSSACLWHHYDVT